MSSKNKIIKFLNDNVVLLTGIPLIIGVHWGWSKLQNVPYLVDPNQKKDIPIVAAITAIKNKAVNLLNGSEVNKKE